MGNAGMGLVLTTALVTMKLCWHAIPAILDELQPPTVKKQVPVQLGLILYYFWNIYLRLPNTYEIRTYFMSFLCLISKIKVWKVDEG